MWILVPLLMDQYVNSFWLGFVLSFFSVMCLQSIDEVGKELENPFRNIPNELPVVTYQAEYNEALVTIYNGFHPDAYWKPSREHRNSTKFFRPSNVSQLSQEDLSAIKEAASRGGESIQSKESGEYEKMNVQMRVIIDQQNRMMEQMMKEQKRLNDTLEKVLIQSNQSLGFQSQGFYSKGAQSR